MPSLPARAFWQPSPPMVFAGRRTPVPENPITVHRAESAGERQDFPVRFGLFSTDCSQVSRPPAPTHQCGVRSIASRDVHWPGLCRYFLASSGSTRRIRSISALGRRTGEGSGWEELPLSSGAPGGGGGLSERVVLLSSIPSMLAFRAAHDPTPLRPQRLMPQVSSAKPCKDTAVGVSYCRCYIP
jgi:hypothetical protein